MKTIVIATYWENRKSMLMFFLLLFSASIHEYLVKIGQRGSKVKQFTALFVPTNTKRATAHV